MASVCYFGHYGANLVILSTFGWNIIRWTTKYGPISSLSKVMFGVISSRFIHKGSKRLQYVTSATTGLI